MAKAEDLHAFLAEHLRYEWWMLNATFSRALKSGAEGDIVALNAFIESFWIHARISIAFLRNESDQNGIKAKNYDKEYKASSPPKVLERLNSQITHFSKKREGAEKLDAADMKAALEWINAEFDVFRNRLPEPLRNALHDVEKADTDRLSNVFGNVPSASSQPMFSSSEHPSVSYVVTVRATD